MLTFEEFREDAERFSQVESSFSIRFSNVGKQNNNEVYLCLKCPIFRISNHSKEKLQPKAIEFDEDHEMISKMKISEANEQENVIPNSNNELIRLEVHIVYSRSFGVPVLYFNAYRQCIIRYYYFIIFYCLLMLFLQFM
jgi:hypothetical protein